MFSPTRIILKSRQIKSSDRLLGIVTQPTDSRFDIQWCQKCACPFRRHRARAGGRDAGRDVQELRGAAGGGLAGAEGLPRPGLRGHRVPVHLLARSGEQLGPNPGVY